MATTTKRAYKLQEFVAHSLSVNCLKIGRKTSRVLVTGGEDHKVNLWSIGKPNAILTLSGHTSAIESVNFDSSEVLVAAGAASGSIKLWDLEEAKIVRTLTGHRSNCISVDFHPFGEFFASGSLDTNLKIWDIRRKGCIHTYKGHTRGVNAIRFTPDGRWVVSGGEDNSVKLWDLTAGKLLHDFKCHEGQIQCIDFHPHEFLLATGSSDKTVKLWDLETFEMVGSSGPETSGVRAMTFNPDGRTLLCGLHESLKVLSWEPMRCHDTVDVGWSKLSDLNIYEGKLLGCSYNQSCVGVWVVDLSQVEPYAVSSATKVNGRSGSKPSSIRTAPINNDNDLKANLGRLSVSQNTDQGTKETKVKQYTKHDATENLQTTPPRLGSNANLKTDSSTFTSIPSAPINKRGLAKAQNANNIQNFNKPDGIPVIVPKNGPQAEVAPEPRKETTPARTPSTVRSRLFDFRKQEIGKVDAQRETPTIPAVSASPRTSESAEATGQNFSSSTNVVKQTLVPSQRNVIDVRYTRERKLGSVTQALGPTPSYSLENHDARLQKPRETYPLEVPRRGRTGSLVSGWEHRERSPSLEDSSSNSSFENRPFANMPFGLRGRSASVGKDRFSDDSEDLFSNLSEQHEPFLSSMQCRLTKLQVLHRLWQRKDARGLISAAEKMSDHAVSTDIVSVLVEKCDIITLDLCTSLLSLLNGLLTGDTDRSISISLEMLLKLVRMFGAVISSTVSAPTPVGVDLEAEQRIERCNICFIELQKVKSCLPSLTRKGGTISRSSQELILALQEVL